MPLLWSLQTFSRKSLQDDHQGVLEEVRGDEEAEADEQDTGQPETIVAPGETSVVENPREAGLSDSHLERPLHLSKFSEEGSTRS